MSAFLVPSYSTATIKPFVQYSYPDGRLATQHCFKTVDSVDWVHRYLHLVVYFLEK